MKEKQKKHFGIRILNMVCALSLIGNSLYIFFIGLSFTPIFLLSMCIAGLAGPVVMGSSEGFLDSITQILGAFVEGVFEIFSIIGDFFGSLMP